MSWPCFSPISTPLTYTPLRSDHLLYIYSPPPHTHTVHSSSIWPCPIYYSPPPPPPVPTPLLIFHFHPINLHSSSIWPSPVCYPPHPHTRTHTHTHRVPTLLVSYFHPINLHSSSIWPSHTCPPPPPPRHTHTQSPHGTSHNHKFFQADQLTLTWPPPLPAALAWFLPRPRRGGTAPGTGDRSGVGRTGWPGWRTGACPECSPGAVGEQQNHSCSSSKMLGGRPGGGCLNV